MKPSREEFIARIRHLGWCCYQIAAGQDYNIEPNKDQYESLLQGVKFGLQNLDMTPEQNHENWMKCKTEQGWVYGEVKDFKKKTHPDLVPFDELPKIEADKDIMDAMMNKEANKLYDLFFKANTNLKDTIREIHDNVAQEMYCKGIDDLCNEISTYRMYDEYGNVIDVLEIVKRLKE